MGTKSSGHPSPKSENHLPSSDSNERYVYTYLESSSSGRPRGLGLPRDWGERPKQKAPGRAPYFNANFGGGIGKLFGAATNDFMQGGVGAVTDAAVNSYHEVAPPPTSRSSSAAALCRTTTRFTPHRRATLAAADPWVCGRGAREA